jgi:hypothetical protein
VGNRDLTGDNERRDVQLHFKVTFMHAGLIRHFVVRPFAPKLAYKVPIRVSSQVEVNSQLVVSKILSSSTPNLVSKLIELIRVGFKFHCSSEFTPAG